MPTTRPGIVLDNEGVCNACRWHDKKQQIDWSERQRDLEGIAEWARERSHGPWDCVVGVSGGKDSTWQAAYLQEQLGLRTLLVQFSCSEGTDLGRKNLENLVHMGSSLVSVHPSPEVARRLSKRSFYHFGNIAKYSETCLFPIPFRVAMAYEIPLVFFGENPALECGDTNLSAEPWDATTIRHNNTLGGANINIWLGDGIEKRDILPYSFPPEDEFCQWGGKGIFMGYYLNWSGYRNAVFSIQRGFLCQEAGQHETGDLYRHNALDFMYTPVHTLIKCIKLGFGNTTEFVCYDIRAGRVSREEAIALVREFDGQCHPRYIEMYCDWIGISVEEFWRVTNTFRGKMWSKNPDGRWKLTSPIWEQEPVKNKVQIDEILKRLDTERVAANNDNPRVNY